MANNDNLRLGEHNNAETATHLIGRRHNYDTTNPTNFSGNHILEVKPNPELLNQPSVNHGGIFAMGVGAGTGVLAVGEIGVKGESATVGKGIGVLGKGDVGVRGDGGSSGVHGEGITGVYGKSNFGDGVKGEGATGVTATGLSTGVDARGPIGVYAEGGDQDGGRGVDASGYVGVQAGGKRTGVQANGATGVWTKGTDGPGINAGSTTNRGGLFGADVTAQIRLAPTLELANPSALSTPAEAGDLLALLHRRGEEGEVFTSSLWFCTRGGDPGTASWTQLA